MLCGRFTATAPEPPDSIQASLRVAAAAPATKLPFLSFGLQPAQCPLLVIVAIGQIFMPSRWVSTDHIHQCHTNEYMAPAEAETNYYASAKDTSIAA